MEGADLQGECRVLLEDSMLERNAAVNGAAFFASSIPCFMVTPSLPLPHMLSLAVHSAQHLSAVCGCAEAAV